MTDRFGVAITVKVEGVEDLTRGLSDLAKTQVPWAKVTALTWTGYSAKKRLYAEMRSKFKAPTPFVVPRSEFDRVDSMGSMRVEWATLAKPYSVVLMKDQLATKQRVATDPLLRHHFFGGARVARGLEIWFRQLKLIDGNEYLILGKDADKNKYGNMSGGTYKRMVSQLKIDATAGYDVSATNSKRSKKSQAVAGKYFWSAGPGGPKKIKDMMTGITYGLPGGSAPGRQNNLPKGVWVRNGSELVCLLAVVKKAPTYKRLFDLQKIASDAVREDFAKNFDSALTASMKNSGFKGKWKFR